MSEISSLRHLQSINAVCTDVLSSLQTVEINSIDLCNRSCSFCPHSSVETYPNKKLKMSLDTITAIATQLSEFNYSNRVSFVGFGEPFLNKNLSIYIQTIKSFNPSIKWLEVNTNGDFITRNKVEDLANAGCTHLTISMYDYDITEKISELLYGVDIILTFKHLYNHETIALVNRKEIVNDTIYLGLSRQCYVPFYKMFIDWNGDVLLCNNDWGRESIIDNINNRSIKDIWMGDTLFTYRKLLYEYNRSLVPCNKCNIHGTLYGRSSVDTLLNFIK